MHYQQLLNFLVPSNLFCYWYRYVSVYSLCYNGALTKEYVIQNSIWKPRVFCNQYVCLIFEKIRDMYLEGLMLKVAHLVQEWGWNRAEPSSFTEPYTSLVESRNCCCQFFLNWWYAVHEYAISQTVIEKWNIK